MLDQLCCQEDLLSLGNQGIVHELLLHVVGALVQAVNAQPAVVLGDLASLDLGQSLDWWQTRVLGKSQWHSLERLGESAHGVLVNTGNLIGGLGDSQRAGNLGSTTTVDNTVITDQVADDADGIVERALSLVNDHLVASTNKHGNGAGVCALFNDQHAVLSGSKAQLTNDTSVSELGGREILETGDNASVCGNGNQLIAKNQLLVCHPFKGGVLFLERKYRSPYLNLGTSNPANTRKLVLHQQMVGLVIESPLADNKVGASVLDLLDHLLELLLLVCLQLLVLLNGCNVQLVLGLGLWGLKRAGQNGNLGILDLAGHLGVREVLVDDNSLDKNSVGQRTSNLAINLDQLEINVLALQVGNLENSIHSDPGILVVALGDTK